MAKKCDICGKGPQVGNTVSHAHNLTSGAGCPTFASCGSSKTAIPHPLMFAPAACVPAKWSKTVKIALLNSKGAVPARTRQTMHESLGTAPFLFGDQPGQGQP